MHRFPSLPLLLAPLALASVLAACTADLEDGCISGPCGPGTAPQPTGTGGGGGSGGSGGGDACAGTPQTGDYPCDVYEALKAKCFACHTSPLAGGAPFPLLTLADTRELYGPSPRWQRMAVVIDSGFMPFGSVAPKLTADEKKTLLDWLNACAVPEPAGQGCGCTDPAACP